MYFPQISPIYAAMFLPYKFFLFLFLKLSLRSHLSCLMSAFMIHVLGALGTRFLKTEPLRVGVE